MFVWDFRIAYLVLGDFGMSEKPLIKQYLQLRGEFVWRKLYMPLMPKSLGPVIWGFSEY